MFTFFQSKIIPSVLKFASSKGLSAVRDGMVATMTLTIIGSIFLILAQLPYKPAADWFIAIGLTPLLLHAYYACFQFLAGVAVFGITYSYVKSSGYEPLPAGILSLTSFLVLIPHNVAETASVFPFEYLAAKGMIASIIVGLIVAKVYCFFMDRNITIKMPAGVPQGVSDSFAALIPGIAIITLSFIVYSVTLTFTGKTIIDLIYELIQTPLTGITGSFWGVIAIAFLISFLWWFGAHGSTIVGAVIRGIVTANLLENQALFEAGELTIENGGHILTSQFNQFLVAQTGAGITIGIVLALLVFAKSKQLKALGKVSLGPSIFNINEPITFGLPVVLNPVMFIPFVLVPVLAAAISYFALYTGIVPLFNAVIPPWTTPSVISGLLIGGWPMAVLQLLLVAMSFAIYTPFVRYLDKKAVVEEENATIQVGA